MIRRKRAHASFVVAVLLLAGASSVPSASRADVELRGLLHRLDRVAALYRDEALRFTCDETISFYGRSGGRSLVRKYSYVFVHDDEGRLRDHRLPRSAKKGEPAQPVDMRRSDLPSWVLRAYSSILLFEATEQKRYRYEIVGREKALGRPAIRVALEPRVTTDASDSWRGTVWIDAESYQMLRFERQMEQWERRGRVEAPPDRVEIQSVSTEFGVQRNGMRFPSLTTVSAMSLSPSGLARMGVREIRVFTVTQKYKRYRFYNVRTTEQINRAVWADD